MEQLPDPDPGDLTGLAAVDTVIRSLDRLDSTPLDEHVALFEEAHASLRAALEPADVVPMPRPDVGASHGAADPEGA